ncbi:tRNA-dihydrouridine synthase family protein [Geofilum rubicundum]|nr:tRNA-dihydrouridine synthase family protein [Geofilum rubicundum]
MGGVDTYYAPYIRLQGHLDIKKSYMRDLLPVNNSVRQLIPQVMTNSAEEFLFVAAFVQGLGYQELNWNLGCPYPMVTRRGLGSGLLKHTGKIDDLLRRVSDESEITVSLKLRLGYDDSHEILNLLPVLEKHKIKNLIIHPDWESNFIKEKSIWIHFNNVLKIPVILSPIMATSTQ